MTDPKQYVKEVIKRGGEGSDVLEVITRRTLNYSGLVDTIEVGGNGLKVLHIPEDKLVAVHTAHAPPKKDVQAWEIYGGNLVRQLVSDAQQIGAKPVAMVNVIDSYDGNPTLLGQLAEGMSRASMKPRVSIMNGENAILGERITKTANLSGTMVSLVPREDYGEGTFARNAVQYAVFDPEGLPVFMNADGVGTKTEMYERAGVHYPALDDLAAMNLDDAARVGADVRVLSAVIEWRNTVQFAAIREHMKALEEKLNLDSVLQFRRVDDRIVGYNEGAPAYHVNGAVVSVIDTDILKNQLVPQAGDTLVAICGEPNARSNGFTSKRRVLKELAGSWSDEEGVVEWHEHPNGKQFLDFLSKPSTILYPAVRELTEAGLVHGFYHMSGGAYDGKLARPLAESGLFVRLNSIFLPNKNEVQLAAWALGNSKGAAYAQWPMGTQGFVATQNANAAIRILEEQGLKAKQVGVLEKAEGEKTGVQIASIYDNHKEVYFSGK